MTMVMTAVIRRVLLVCIPLLSGCMDDKLAQMSQRLATAQANVIVLPDTMLMPGLQRQRTIRLYLPPGYAESAKHYPVLYMHDAQNLFDDATSYAGEWGIDETLNELAQSKGLELIVVGIDNGLDKRMNELSPWANEEFGPGEGEQYMDFIVTVVKPYVDGHYRSRGQRQHTAIMGSSMGGLISHYAIHQYPQVFAKAGVFSPSFWYASESYKQAQQHPLPVDARVYYLAGTAESDTMVGHMLKMAQQQTGQGHPAQNIQTKVVADGQHNEGFWRSEFATAIQWLFRP